MNKDYDDSGIGTLPDSRIGTPAMFGTQADEMRPFQPVGLKAQVDAAIAELPADTPVAVVGYANRDGAGFGAMARLGDRWSFIGKIEKPWDGRFEAGVAVVWTPRSR